MWSQTTETTVLAAGLSETPVLCVSLSETPVLSAGLSKTPVFCAVLSPQSCHVKLIDLFSEKLYLIGLAALAVACIMVGVALDASPNAFQHTHISANGL